MAGGMHGGGCMAQGVHGRGGMHHRGGMYGGMVGGVCGGEACVAWGVRGRTDRYCSGQYTSYWNVFLLSIMLINNFTRCKFTCFEDFCPNSHIKNMCNAFCLVKYPCLLKLTSFERKKCRRNVLFQNLFKIKKPL